MKKTYIFVFVGIFLIGFVGCAKRVSKSGGEIMNVKIASDINERLSRFKPTELSADISGLTSSQKRCLSHVVRAAKYMDEIFLNQVYSDNEKWLKWLESCDCVKRDAALEYFWINFGPFDRLNGYEPFIDDLKAPLGANFYPSDMTKEEFEKWIEAHPSERKAFESPFTVIKREGKSLRAVPYSEVYKKWLEPAALELKAAADVCENKSLSKFLRSRAEAFLSNDYRKSDMDWMDVSDNVVDVTIGPYEVYEDRLFGYKASFEAFVAIRDAAASEELAKIKKHLDELEKNLPIPDELRGPKRGGQSPISVVNLIFTAGDTKAGVQTIAFNLPNDEVVRAAKGSKKVMLANAMKAKFEGILKPIAKKVLRTDQLKDLSGDVFVNITLYHEISHGMGPGRIKGKDGRETTVNAALKETYSTLEEAKADITSVYNQLWMIDKGYMPRSMEKKLYATFLAGIFRSVRFGAEEAHGKANMINFNYLFSRGAFDLDAKTGTYYYVADKMRRAVRDLVADIMLIQAKGDYDGSKKFIEKYGHMRPDMKRALGRLKDVPVDIKPVYPVVEKGLL